MSEEKKLLLSIKDLEVAFKVKDGTVRAVDQVSLNVYQGQVLCIVGESGCGKSVTAKSIIRLVTKPGKIVGGSIIYYGKEKEIDLVNMDQYDPVLRSLRGGDISLIFQEPMSALSPVHTIGDQMIESLMLHSGKDKNEARKIAVEWLKKVGINNPKERIKQYSFELSGGQRQRIMIAMALCCNPKLLIADEPTTALDVTMQLQVLKLLKDLQEENDLSLLYITHNMGVVAEIATEVVVMYLGRVFEYGTVEEIFNNPLHPYTQGLLHAIPSLKKEQQQLFDTIPGSIPHPLLRPEGCLFEPRCDKKIKGLCDIKRPVKSSHNGHIVECFLYNGANNGE